MRTQQRDRRGGKPDTRTKPGSKWGAHVEHLFGRNAVREALSGRRHHHLLTFADGIRWDKRLYEMRSLAESRQISIEMAPRQLLDDIVDEGRHQGVVLRTSAYPYVEYQDLPRQGRPVLLLDHLQDPQNFGSLLRSAEAFGVTGVIIPRDRSGEITPAVVNASAGAVEHQFIARVTNLGRTIDDLKESGYWIVGLDRTAISQPLDDFDPPNPVALVVGAEGKGLTASVSAQCDILVSIDQVGQIDSLNASVAGSIALFHLTRKFRNQYIQSRK
ncbi:23S rRNA (guanosine(2251)-2'-O)-methyltransferase RlmB [soil metagenome]